MNVYINWIKGVVILEFRFDIDEYSSGLLVIVVFVFLDGLLKIWDIWMVGFEDRFVLVFFM